MVGGDGWRRRKKKKKKMREMREWIGGSGEKIKTKDKQTTDRIAAELEREGAPQTRKELQQQRGASSSAAERQLRVQTVGVTMEARAARDLRRDRAPKTSSSISSSRTLRPDFSTTPDPSAGNAR
jgi:hypothetical protein